MVLTLHTVSTVVVQAVLTPAVHVEAAAQVVHGVRHGVLPDVEKVLPASHGTVHTIGLMQESNAGRQLDAVHSPHRPESRGTLLSSLS